MIRKQPIPGTTPIFGIEPVQRSFHNLNDKSEQRVMNSHMKQLWRNKQLSAGTWKK